MFEELNKKDQEIDELKNLKEELNNKILNLENHNRKLWARIESQDLKIKEYN